MIVEVTLLAGRLHATPWGRHVNEAVPEWPPAPFRLLRALVDCWHRKHPTLAPDVVERLLRALAVPPRYRLPPACAGHTRSYLTQGSEDPTDKKLVFDGFAIVERSTPLLVGWPGLVLDAEARAVAAQLFGSLGYLGRSETWVSCRVLDDADVAWNCEPLTDGVVADGHEAVSVAGVVEPATYDARPWTVPAKGKKKARAVPWLEALCWGSAEAIAHTMNRPPALEPTFYVRRRDALDARPPPVSRRATRVVEAVRFAVDGRVAAPLTDALRVGEHVRRNLMGALKFVAGEDGVTSRFSGKDALGQPVKNHEHISILSLDEDGDGLIDVVLLTSPAAFTVAEQRAIDRLRPVPRRNGHPLVLTPLRYGTREELGVRAHVVHSVTPFAPPEHWRLKRDGPFGAWMTAQVRQEARRRGLPEPVEVGPAEPRVARRRVRWLDFARARKDDAPQPAFGLRLRFDEPVLAPFSLGYGSHFGLGCFVAIDRSDD